MKTAVKILIALFIIWYLALCSMAGLYLGGKINARNPNDINGDGKITITDYTLNRLQGIEIRNEILGMGEYDGN